MIEKNKIDLIVRTTVFTLVFFAILIIPLKVFAAENDFYEPITGITGFDADVVADSKDDLLNHTQTIDTSNNHGSRYLSPSFAPNEPSDSQGFFPGGKIITTSTGKKFYLQQSTDNNDLKITSGTKSLIVNTQSNFERLGLLVSGGNGATNFNIVIEYTDGSKSQSMARTAPDWYTGDTNKKVYTGLWRANNDKPEVVEKSDWQGQTSGLYECDVDVDSSKIISKLTFTRTSGGVLNVFGVSGIIGNDRVCTINFETNDGNIIYSQNGIKGNKITKPKNPTKDGFVFDGWYSDSELTNEFDFDSPVSGDITLYAKWRESEKVNDNTIESNNQSSAINNSTPESNNQASAINNPKTGDNMLVYLLMLVLSIIGFAGAGIYMRKKNFN